MSSRNGTCLKIGLDVGAEYSYLVKDNWKEIAASGEGDEHRIPVFDVDRWNYYGVDANPRSIAHCVERYKDLNERVHFITAAVADASKLVGLHLKGPQSGIMNGLNSRVLTPAYSLDDLLAHLAISSLEILALDVEGSEYMIFEAYSWRIKPVFMDIEVHVEREHGDAMLTDFVNSIKRRGYEWLYCRMDHDLPRCGLRTHICHFKRI